MRPPPSTRPGTRKKGAAHRLRGWDSDQARYTGQETRGSAPSPVKRGAEMGRPRSPLQWEAIERSPCAQACGTCLIYRKSFKGCSVINDHFPEEGPEAPESKLSCPECPHRERPGHDAWPLLSRSQAPALSPACLCAFLRGRCQGGSWKTEALCSLRSMLGVAGVPACLVAHGNY